MRGWTALGTCLVLFASPVASRGHGDTFARAAVQAQIEVVAVPSRTETARPPDGRTGDVERLVWSVRDRYGRTVGVGLFSCRWVLRSARLCDGEITMPLGKLAVIGSSSTRELGVYSVVGGTGRYVGAQGELVFRAIGFRKLVVSMSI